MRIVSLSLLAALLLAPLPAAAQVPSLQAPCAPPNAPDPMPDGNGHDHADPGQHRFSCRMNAVATLDLKTTVPEPSMFGEIDVALDLAVVATSFPEAGFVVLDVSDPGKPVPLSRFRGPRCETETDYDCGADVKLTRDGRWAFLAVQRTGRNAAKDDAERLDPGIVTVDLSNPRSPRRAAFTQLLPVGVHMLAYHPIDGAGYVWARTSDTGPDRNGRGVAILRLRDDGSLERVGDVTVDAAHDVSLYDDPVDDTTYLYVSGAQAGALYVFDVGDVRNPRKAGEWKPEPEIDDNVWYMHNAWTFRSGAKRYTFAGVELYRGFGSLQPGHGDAAGPVWLLDTTDHARPVVVGEWRNPGKRAAGDLTFSPHQLWYAGDGVAWLSHYHGGVWALDWSPVLSGASRRPREIGYHVPHEIRRDFVVSDAKEKFITAPPLLVRPLIWDVVATGRYAFASDINAGLVVLELESPSPSPSPGAAGEPGRGGGIVTIIMLLIVTVGALPLVALIRRRK